MSRLQYRDRIAAVATVCYSLVLVGAAVAVSAEPAVKVSTKGPMLSVQIAAPTPLRAVLTAVCEEARGRCELADGLEAVIAPPRLVAGTWEEVIGSLLQDSGFSYAVTSPAGDRPAHLFVSAPIPTGMTGSRTTASAQALNVAADPQSAMPPSSESEQTAEAAAPTEDEQPAEASTTLVDPASATLVTAATAAASPDVHFAMTPFADAQGNPLMSRVSTPPGAAAPSMAVLPYSDEAGNPLMTPITNEPLSLTPFAGPDGEPWPAPVVVPGPKLEYPMSPTLPPAMKPENQ